MKRILIAGAFALVAGTQAFAADLPPPAPMPPPRAPAAYIPAPSPIYNWGGIYLGINGGYGFGNSSWAWPGTSSGNFSVNGGLVGATIGFNYQMNAFVVGFEGDFDYQNARGATGGVCAAAQGCDTSSNYIGTFRGRLGWAVDRILFYGTAGGAVTDIRYSTGALPWASSSQFGWTAGAGVEGAITDNITAKVEYLFADFGSATCSAAANCVVAPLPATVKLYENIVRVGLNYKF